MGSSSKKRATMAKMTRERAVKERRERKQLKKDERKQAQAAGSPDLADAAGQAHTGDEQPPSA
jgi:hypothetical protein